MSRTAIKRRVAALAAIISPIGSLDGRAAKLPPGQQEAYAEWRSSCNAWHAKHPGAEAYRLMLDGFYGPQPPDALRYTLGLRTPRISAGTSASQAARLYLDILTKG